GGLGSIAYSTLVSRIRHGLVRSPYAPVTVVRHITESVALYIDEHARAFAGVHVGSLPQRSYPQGRLGGEFLGLLGEGSGGPPHPKPYRDRKPGEIVGQSGVEASYDPILNGGLTRATVAVDSAGVPLGPLHLLRRPKPGKMLRLTVDARLQRAAERA